MQLEEEINKIQKRNMRVEKDKAWEISITRKVSICLITYIIVLVYNLLLSSKMTIYITSAVPVIGYFLSTLSLPIIRKLWEERK